MEKMNLYDNLDDEEEKQSIKIKIKVTRMIEVKNRSLSIDQLHLW